MGGEKQPQRQSRYSDRELDLINKTFAENEDLLKAIRKKVLQMELSGTEEQMLTSTIKGDVLTLIRKVFIPELDGNASISNLSDKHWVHTEDRALDAIYFDILVNEKKYEYLEKAVENITDFSEDNTLKELVNREGKKEHEVCVNYATRAKIMNHVESILQAVFVIAGKKDETVEARLKRMGADSSK